MRSESITRRAARPLLVSLAVYLVLLLVSGGALDRIDDPPVVLAATLALLPPSAAAAGLFLQRRQLRSEDGIERTVYAESAAIAFLVTMLAALSYGFLQEGADAPALNGFVVWGFGMGVWAVASAVMNRRLR